MRLFVVSDIHGSLEGIERALNFYEKNPCDNIVLLGDILYHGPRNPLPAGHNPKAVAELLNKYSAKIIASRGNCDAEVDQMVLSFPCMSDYALIADGAQKIFCTHGHVYSPERADGTIAVPETNPRKINYENVSVIFYGHTHVQVLEKNKSGTIICNPGSVSLPKNKSPAGFAIYDSTAGDLVTLYDINGQKISSLR